MYFAPEVPTILMNGGCMYPGMVNAHTHTYATPAADAVCSDLHRSPVFPHPHILPPQPPSLEPRPSARARALSLYLLPCSRLIGHARVVPRRRRTGTSWLRLRTVKRPAICYESINFSRYILIISDS